MSKYTLLEIKTPQNTLFVKFYKIFPSTIVQVFFAPLHSETSQNLMLTSLQTVIWTTVCTIETGLNT